MKKYLKLWYGTFLNVSEATEVSQATTDNSA